MTLSIRRRLLLTLLLAITSIWILVVVYMYQGAQREVRELFDTQLEESARVAWRTLLGLPAEDTGGRTASDPVADQTAGPPPGAPAGPYQKNLVVQVWDASGELFLHSQSAPLAPLSEAPNGFVDSTIDGTRWRTYSFRDPEHGVTVKVGEPYQARDTLTRHVVSQTLYPLLFGLPLLAVLIWFAVGRGLRPLDRVAREVSSRDSRNLDKLTSADVPDEIKPLIHALNELLRRLDDAFDRERRFTADAAHELRTPLAGLKTQAQVALASTQHSERRNAVLNVLKGVDRAAHLVDQLLTLSRLDQSTSIANDPVDLRPIIRTLAEDLSGRAVGKSIEIRLAMAAEKTVVPGNADAIYMLARNLLDNAIRYSPEGSTVSVATVAEDDAVTLEVRDQGPGIPESERDNVLERFYRGPTFEREGSGLGLSIVQRIVNLHGARLTLDTAGAGQGLVARVRFPVSVGTRQDRSADATVSARDPTGAGSLQPTAG